MRRKARNNRRRFSIASCLAALFAGPFAGAGGELPYAVGERIEFRLRWGIVVAGKATLEVHEPVEIDGERAQHFSTTIRTTGLADRIYRVRTRIDSFVMPDGTRTLQFRKKQREGKVRNNVVVRFDWSNRSATLEDRRKNKVRDPIRLPQTATDLVGALYRFRRMALAEGSAVQLPVTDGEKVIQGRAQLVDTERVKVPAGRFEAFKVALKTEDLSGVFDKDDDASLYLWFTSDRHRRPVRVASAVMIGNFIAEAVDIEAGKTAAASQAGPE